MEITKMEAAIEAILFSIGEAVPLQKIAEAIQQDITTTKRIINNMRDRFEKDHHGIQLIEIENSYQLCTKPEYYEQIRQLTNKTKEFLLTDVLIETLSIIAYKQPITKSHIEDIRGVNSYHAVNKLVEYKLVEEVGRMEAPGRPILFGTTQEFLRCFGFQSIEELPSIEEEQIVSLKNEVEKEFQLKLVE